MKRLTTFAFLLSAFSATSYAEEVVEDKSKNSFIAGVSAGGSYISKESEYNFNTIIGIDDIPGDFKTGHFGFNYGLKLGYDISIQPFGYVRVFANYTNIIINEDRILGKFNAHSIGINADYRYEFSNGLSLFAGLGISVNITNTTGLGDYTTAGFNVGGGILYNILSFLELELRLSYIGYDINDRRSNYIPPDITGPNNMPITSHLVDINNPISLSLGVNARF